LNNNYTKNSFLTFMAVTNSIFNDFATNKKIVQGKYITSLDSGIMNAEEEAIFNTYKHWQPFYVPMQDVIKDGKSTNDKKEPIMESVTAMGTKSLFNNYNAVYIDNDFREDANMPLLDNPDSRNRQRKNMSCTIKDLVDASASGSMGRQVYNYSDFAYCKHLGKISNNYLITLRRFGAPCGDKIDKRNYAGIAGMEEELQQHLPDVGRLITWMGTPGNEMGNILKYSYSMPWEDMEAKIEEVNTGDSEGGKLASIFNMANANYRTNVQKGLAGSNYAGKGFIDGMLGGDGATNPPYSASAWSSMYDSTKVHGPIDVINKTKRRKTGLVFEQKFTLVFDYELRSYYGVNGKAAMTDLLGNILATTYTHGNWWGGERRFVGAMQDNVFANLPIFKLADSGGLNNPGAVLDAFIDSVHQGAAAFSNGVKGETTKEKIKNLAKDIGGMLLGGMLNKLGRPHKIPMASLISGAPVGCWHLTVGNPKSPIIEIGNLVCTGTEIEHYGPLGLDDFPTGLRVKVNLEHAKPRDIMAIEQMYGRGDTRIYSPMGANVMKMYETSTSISIKGVPKTDTKFVDKLNKIVSEVNNGAVKNPKDGSTTIDRSNLDVQKEFATSTSETEEISINKIESLKRYFGTEESSMIAFAGGEALYGAEKRKNDHAK
jgi:hypothetical protein